LNSRLVIDTVYNSNYFQSLEEACFAYYKMKVMLRGGSYFHNNDFTIGKVLPDRARRLYERLGCGYGMASMQGSGGQFV